MARSHPTSKWGWIFENATCRLPGLRRRRGAVGLVRSNGSAVLCRSDVGHRGRRVRQRFPRSRARGGTKVRVAGRWWQHRPTVQTTIGLILTVAVLLTLLGLVGTACLLAVQGHGARIEPLLQAA